MSPRARIDTETVVTSVTAVAAGGVAAALVLVMLAQPSGYAAQVRQVSDQVGRGADLLQASGDIRYPAAAICHADADAAAAALKQRIQVAASGLNLANFKSAPSGGPDGAGMQPVTFGFELTGPYDAAIQALDRLKGGAPYIFVDQLDLKSNVSAVDLSVSGRVFCSTTAQN